MTTPNQNSRGQPNGLGVFAVLVVGAIALVVFTLTLLLGMTLVGSIAAEIGGAPPGNKTVSPDPATGTAVEFAETEGASEVLEVYQVQDSTGRAIALTGAPDSYYQSRERVDLAADDTWSVSTWARVDSGAAGETMTAISANGRVLIQYNGTSGEWVGWYYDDGTGNSYRLAGAAPNQPQNLSLVTLTANGTHVTLYRNTTQLDTQSVTTAAVESAELNATGWNGVLDEARVFDDATNASEQATLHANPVAPRPARNRTARLMFDEGSGKTTAIYFTPTVADLSNTTWVASGLPGHTLDEGTDYEIDADSGTITALAGGRIDGAPVVWIDIRYKSLNAVGEVGAAISGAFGLFGASVLVVPAVAVLAVLVGSLVAVVSGSTGSMPGMERNNGR